MSLGDPPAVLEALKGFARRQAPYRRWLQRKHERLLAEWAHGSGEGPAPNLLKERVVREYGRCFGARTLVETGTYLGEMVEAMAPSFDHIHSIELDAALHRRALGRLAHLGNVTLRQGDSGEVLRDVIAILEGPCVFWLDGHYSGGVTARGSEDSPVRREIDQIAASGRKGDVVLIDDARCFDGRGGYPTIAETVEMLQSRLSVVVSVAEDIIRATPQWP